MHVPRDEHQTNRSVNDQPYFVQNGLRQTSSSGDNLEIGNFRRALPQFLAVSVKNILLFVYGMTLGFPTIVIPAIQGGDGREPSDIVLNREQISWFSSINLICVPMGCIFSGAFSQPIGKKLSMQLVNLPILASWLLFHFSTKTEHLYAALCLSGLGGGLMEAPVLTYVAEITEPKYRGILSALGSTCVISGVFIQFIMGSFLDWRTIAAVSTAFPVVCIVSLFFIPESPTWLIRKHRFKEAIRSLQWLRGWVHESQIEDEFNMLYELLITKPAREEADEKKKSTECAKRLKIFRKQTFWYPFLLISLTFFIGHFSGKTALQTYAVQIFHTLKAPINKYHATILLGMCELIATILCVILIHFTGKRPLVLLSSFGCGLCFFGTATYAYYLNVVPGFAINNVVVNASSLIPKENIIGVDNITRLFEKEERALLMADKLNNIEEIVTTFLPELLIDSSTYTNKNEEVTEAFISTQYPLDFNRTKRGADPSDEEIGFNITDDYFIFTDMSTTDPNEQNDTLTTIINSKEITTDTTDIQRIIEEKEPTLTHIKSPELPVEVLKTEQVENKILLPVPNQKENKLVWVPLVLLLSSAFFAHLGIRLIPWVLIGEIFPASVRSTASGLVSGVGYIFGFLANKLFLQMLASMTMPGTFWFYSSVAIIGSIILYFFLPETEGKTLGEIEEHFSKKTKKVLAPIDDYPHQPKQTTAQIPFDNMHIPMDPQVIARGMHLRQSDLIPRSTNGRKGATNRGFDNDEVHNTTHL